MTGFPMETMSSASSGKKGIEGFDDEEELGVLSKTKRFCEGLEEEEGDLLGRTVEGVLGVKGSEVKMTSFEARYSLRMLAASSVCTKGWNSDFTW